MLFGAVLLANKKTGARPGPIFARLPRTPRESTRIAPLSRAELRAHRRWRFSRRVGKGCTQNGVVCVREAGERAGNWIRTIFRDAFNAAPSGSWLCKGAGISLPRRLSAIAIGKRLGIIDFTCSWTVNNVAGTMLYFKRRRKITRDTRRNRLTHVL